MTGLAAVIPAAGLSSRMGEFKPLLSLGDGTVLSACVALFRSQGVDRVFVVTGKRAGEVAEAANAAGAAPVHNPNFESGMFSSVLTGVRALPEDADAFFVLPVDIPLVLPETVARLAKTFDETRPAILYPRFLGERGHPPLIGREVVPAILDHDGQGGLRKVLDRFEDRAADLDVADLGVGFDLDHPQDYERAKPLYGREYPLPEECTQLWAMHSVHDHIVGHCRAVSRVAVALANGLNAAGHKPPLDIGLVQGAALTHDMGKGTKRHEEVGAEMLHGHGFHAAAEIVRAHFDTALAPGEPITEREIVFLADKLVRCDRPVPLKDRYLEKVEMYAHEPGAKEAILGRMERADGLRARFDREAGADAEQVAREALA
jgi:CTP:molybdopterin cytidylyltransferase MocA